MLKYVYYTNNCIRKEETYTCMCNANFLDKIQMVRFTAPPPPKKKYKYKKLII